MSKRKTLRHFELSPAIKAMLREAGGESDRAMALTLGAVVDNQVHAIVRKRLRAGLKGRSPLFDGPAAPLSTAYARNAFLLETGVISTAFYADLERVRKIRNNFAHEWAVESFSHASVAGLINQLMPHDEDFENRAKARRKKWRFSFAERVTTGTNVPYRSRFGLAVIVLLVVLYALRKDVRRPKKPRVESIYGSVNKHDAIQIMMDSEEMLAGGVDILDHERRRRSQKPRRPRRTRR